MRKGDEGARKHVGVGRDAINAAKAKAAGAGAGRGSTIEGGHRVEEAGGEAAEAAVAEGGILLLINHVLEVVPELLEGNLVGLVEVEVHEGVEERAAHEELEREIVDALGVLLDCAGAEEG